MFILTSAGSCLASVAAMCACQACQGVTREVLRKSARLAYCALFTTAMVLAWVLRDFAKPLIEKIPCKLDFCRLSEPPLCGVVFSHMFCPFCSIGIVHQATGDISDKWYGQQAVYRLSMGNFVSAYAAFACPSCCPGLCMRILSVPTHQHAGLICSSFLGSCPLFWSASNTKATEETSICITEAGLSSWVFGWDFASSHSSFQLDSSMLTVSHCLTRPLFLWHKCQATDAQQALPPKCLCSAH